MWSGDWLTVCVVVYYQQANPAEQIIKHAKYICKYVNNYVHDTASCLNSKNISALGLKHSDDAGLSRNSMTWLTGTWMTSHEEYGGVLLFFSVLLRLKKESHLLQLY